MPQVTARPGRTGLVGRSMALGRATSVNVYPKDVPRKGDADIIEGDALERAAIPGEGEGASDIGEARRTEGLDGLRLESLGHEGGENCGSVTGAD